MKTFLILIVYLAFIFLVAYSINIIQIIIGITGQLLTGFIFINHISKS